MTQKKAKQDRKPWFRCLTRFLRIFFRKRNYIFLGDIPSTKCIIFSNHVAASAPIFHELYSPFKFRFWGTHEMTENLKENYKYLSTTYLHDKKGFGKGISKILAGIICPFTKIFYNGMQLIPTYKDMSFFKTIKLSKKSIDNGENLIIFPEDSHDGYHEHLKIYFNGGFYAAEKLCSMCNEDIKIYNCYYVKQIRTFVIDKGIPFSKLKEEYKDYDTMAKAFCDRANELGDMYRIRK